ncbi:MAG: N-acetylmuramoyl-L-alanine amidase family 2 protein [Candidatus Peregrinibacteria bacterium Greene0416_19]|nr:MAG: N-acetylmuramoyl-L-alanine amidase family 2 protein [Candidatus Peregrinibacteria bacterium Greene0416_19]
MLRWFAAALLIAPSFALATDGRTDTHSFPEPIDALSVGFAREDAAGELSYLLDGRWSPWLPLAVENEQEPMNRESNLVIFPSPVAQIRLRSSRDESIAVHPIRVAHGPAGIMTAARNDSGGFQILRRSDWGADESLLINGNATTRSDTMGDNGEEGAGNVSLAPRSPEGEVGSSSARVRDCEEMYAKHPDEFRRSKTVKENPDGKPLRWPQEYSPSVKLLVVHHTAIVVSTDSRPGAERMRALYQYHSKNRGWGDIGYHYVIDENGEVYEGRAGGDSVVGGHAYCNNVATLGIALMGNFDAEQPSQTQMRALQWLIHLLAEKYDIEVRRNVTFHGTSLPPVVGHRDLLSTDCPGFYAYGVLDQIRTNVIAGNLTASIRFPVMPTNDRSKYVNRTEERRTRRQQNAVTVIQRREGLFAVGATELVGRPGEETTLSIRYQAGPKARQRRSDIGRIRRSAETIGLWLDRGDSYERLRGNLFIPQFVSAGEEATLRLKLQFPRAAGTETVQIGDVAYVLRIEGRRVRTTGDMSRRTQSKEPGQQPAMRRTVIPPLAPKVITETRPVGQASSSARSTTPTPQPPPPTGEGVQRVGAIRIRLSVPVAERMTIDTSAAASINGSADASRTVLLTRGSAGCAASVDGRVVAEGIVRIDPGTGITTIATWNTPRNRFRGILECRVIDGQLVLINALPLEEYMAGLAEEPDTEPFEKQRAFAVAARSYALHYTDPRNRKYPGMPYDGTDDAARFQLYGGVAFEERNEAWVRAVRATANLVLTANGEVLKTPYFTSNDGRTRDPGDAGWTWAQKYPYAQILRSKPDPWCQGQQLRGHGVGMSGCGAEGQANEGRKAEEILDYYYPGAVIERR